MANNTIEGVKLTDLGLITQNEAENALSDCAVIQYNGFRWILTSINPDHTCTLLKAAEVNAPTTIIKKPIKSDGGSSSYYDLPIPEWLLAKIIERQESTGQAFIKTEECCEVFFGNDFDYSNQFKSGVRSYSSEQGIGKAGNNVEYEQRKIKYSADKIIELSERRKLNKVENK